jgi:hypothetical protein
MQGAADTVMKRLAEHLLGPVEMVVFAAGFMLFMFGLVKYLWVLGDGGEQNEGKQHMLWGIIGMFLMISTWAVISLIDNTFGFGATTGGGAATDVSRLPSNSGRAR